MNARVPSQILQPALALERVGQAWDDDILRQLTEYIAIPAKSPTFAPDWAQLGLLDTVVRNAATWVEAQKVAGLRLEIVRLPGRTPVLFFEIESTEAAATQTVLMYGHLDKQPEFSGWRSDLGPWTPKYEDGKLYGRGGADDGYAVYASIAAVQELKRQNVPHPRIVGLTGGLAAGKSTVGRLLRQLGAAVVDAEAAPLLSVRDLRHRYPDGTEALRGVSLEAGTFFSVRTGAAAMVLLRRSACQAK